MRSFTKSLLKTASTPRLGVTLALLLGALWSSGAVAADSSGSTSAATDPTLTQTYWYDGNIRRPIWIDSQAGTVLTATPVSSGLSKFSKYAATSSAGRAVKGLTEGPATTVVSASTPNVSNASSNATAGAIGSSIKAATDNTTDGSAGTALGKAFPGGVIVALKQPLAEDQAKALLQQQGLTPIREIGAGSGLWLVSSGAGLSSLTLANQLYESGLYRSAQPNWWQERTLK